MCHGSNLYHVYNNIMTITIRSLFLSAYNLFASHTCSFSSHTTIHCSAHNLFVSNKPSQWRSSHKTDWIITDSCPLYLALLYTHVFVYIVYKGNFCFRKTSNIARSLIFMKDTHLLIYSWVLSCQLTIVWNHGSYKNTE